jgi:hypothetical protein
MHPQNNPQRRKRGPRSSIVLAIAGLAVLVLPLVSCKLSEDRLIYHGIVPQDGKTSFEIKVDGSEFPSQTIRVDIQGADEDCDIELENLGPRELTTSYRLRGAAETEGGMIPLEAGQRKRVYSGPSQLAVFNLGDLHGQRAKMKVHVVLKNYQGKNETLTARVLWADGP